MLGLKLSIWLVVSTFACVTVAEIVTRVLECKNAHEMHTLLGVMVSQAINANSIEVSISMVCNNR